MTTLQDAREIAQREQFLAVVSTLQSDGSIQSSIVNAGMLTHPIGGGDPIDGGEGKDGSTGSDVVGFVTYGRAKLRNLRARPQLSVTFRSGWEWAAIEGRAELIGPDDPRPEVDSEQLRLLLRQVFTAAGGTHDDWDAYDRAMAEQRRTVVLVHPLRVYSN
jgi:PPOX class probable F420-dependent enzyme